MTACSVKPGTGSWKAGTAYGPFSWGFVANRVYFAMISEAQRVVAEGLVSAEELDQLMVDCFRWPVGPLGMARGAHSGWES